MVPTILLPAALVGRWGFVPVAALGWAVLVHFAADCEGCFPSAFALGLLNAAVGVALHRLVRFAFQHRHA